MTRLASFLEPLRGLDLERVLGLRPAYPSVAIEVDRRDMVLVRLRRGRGRPRLEAHQIRPLPERGVGASIFRPNLGAPEDLVARVRNLLESTGTRPGRISLVLPDNLAKISLLQLPEKPGSARHLSELVRFKLRRAIPFRLEDATLAHQVLPGEGEGVTVLVTLMLRSVVEQYEQVLEAVGARPGLVDLCTPNLYNLCRSRIAELTGEGDVGLLNVAAGYFSLLIVRGERLIFYRCKSYALGEDDGPPVPLEALMNRELTSSLSYWRDKLGGERLARVLVRAANGAGELVSEVLGRMGVDVVEPVDLGRTLGLAEGRLDPAVEQRIAPAVGAAAGRA